MNRVVIVFQSQSVGNRIKTFDPFPSPILLEKQRKYARTTNSNHPFLKYPNLIQNLIPVEANLIFVSDITYIRIKDGFAYLSLITDLYSRKIVGFKLYPSLETEGCIHALNMALAQIPKNKKIIHFRISLTQRKSFSKNMLLISSHRRCNEA
ncbi:DDE-type integrase/transposase/recombinase [Leptospira alexanderi]|uniref:DDE-type integrase/transposase/recombinase n=1 Tax=Leptospira alexanderi TaxID=100053 RepID=UPI00349F6594